MNGQRRKPIFELSKTARKSKFKAVLDEALKREAEMGLPMISRNKDCVRPGMFVHKYPSGRRLLVEINTENSEQKTIKVLR